MTYSDGWDILRDDVDGTAVISQHGLYIATVGPDAIYPRTPEIAAEFAERIARRIVEALIAQKVVIYG